MSQVARQRSGHPFIRAFVLDLLQKSGIESQNHLSEAMFLGEFVRDNVRYVRDPDDIELLTDPLTLTEQIQRGVAQGDCDDMATLLATYLLSVGIKPKFRAVRYDKKWGHYNHIYVVVNESDWGKNFERAVLDCILKRYPIGAEVPHLSGDDFII